MTGESQADGRLERRGARRSTCSRILVVDDSTTIRRILRRSLEDAGYAVTEAGDGQAALNACRTDPPDLVLLDVDMPVMDGLTALTVMKDDEALNRIPVLFLTARIGGADVAAGLRLGALDYLRKPCEPAELLARVGSALAQAAQHEQLRRSASEANRLSTIDVLTGLGNRRRFDQRVEDLAMLSGGSTPIGLIIFDVDHFKRVNDIQGHPVGDMVLQILAARVQTIVSDPLLLVRWGGEEFMVLSPRMTPDELCKLGESIRNAIGGSPFMVGSDCLLPITVSVGCAAGLLDAIESVIGQADEALYNAKRGGRNRVATYSPATG